MIKHLQIAHTIILETIARKSSSVKRPYKVKLKKEPVVDPETGEAIVVPAMHGSFEVQFNLPAAVAGPGPARPLGELATEHALPRTPSSV